MLEFERSHFIHIESELGENILKVANMELVSSLQRSP